MSFSCGSARRFAALTLFGLKFLYLIGLIFYLIYYAVSGGVSNFVFNRLNVVIVNMGVRTLFIAALVGFALECIGLYGMRTGKCWPNVAYLLMHISVVPYFLYFSNFQYLWALYVASFISTNVFILVDMHSQKNRPQSNIFASQPVRLCLIPSMLPQELITIPPFPFEFPTDRHFPPLPLHHCNPNLPLHSDPSLDYVINVTNTTATAATNFDPTEPTQQTSIQDSKSEAS